MKTILKPRHSVSIILIIRSNMSYINVLTCTHNLPMDRKLWVRPYLFEILIVFDIEFRMTFVDYENS